jgi:hypothetical protein
MLRAQHCIHGEAFDVIGRQLRRHQARRGGGQPRKEGASDDENEGGGQGERRQAGTPERADRRRHPRGGAASERRTSGTQLAWRTVVMKQRRSLAQEAADGALRVDPRAARGTRQEMLVDRLPLGGAEGAVDVRRHEWIDGLAIRH